MKKFLPFLFLLILPGCDYTADSPNFRYPTPIPVILIGTPFGILPTATPAPTTTPAPTATPRATATPQPTATPIPDLSVYVQMTANMTITNGSYLAVGFLNEVYDPSNMHTTASNEDRITAPISGKYLVTAILRYDTNNSGTRVIKFQINGADSGLVMNDPNPLSSSSQFIELSGTLQLAANDYVTVLAYQDSGGNLDLNAGKFQAVRVSY